MVKVLHSWDIQGDAASRETLWVGDTEWNLWRGSEVMKCLVVVYGVVCVIAMLWWLMTSIRGGGLVIWLNGRSNGFLEVGDSFMLAIVQF